MWCNTLIMVQPWPRQTFLFNPDFDHFMPTSIHLSSTDAETTLIIISSILVLLTRIMVEIDHMRTGQTKSKVGGQVRDSYN